MLRALVTALYSAAALPVAAESFQMALPIACDLGQDCHIQQYMDHDPTGGTRDFRCQGLTYDGHKGTDFALPTLRDLDRAVDVIAVAPGKVLGVRNDMPDQLYRREDEAVTRGRECGNGVVIDHGDSWVTQYCHLAQGSVRVSKGMVVDTGTPLGRVGLSGRTQFAHVHLSVRKDGIPVDPFAPEGAQDCDRTGSETLWRDAPAYQPGGLIEIGFATKIPDYAEVKAGNAQETVSASAPALVLFAYAFGGRKGDEIRLQVDGPSGSVVDQTMALEKAQAQFFRASGRRLTTPRWPAGDYTARVEMRRNGQVLGTETARLTIP